jgi:hypothetical protein
MPPPAAAAAAKPAPKPPAGPKTFDDMGVPVVQQKEDCVSLLLSSPLPLPLLYRLPSLVESGKRETHVADFTFLAFSPGDYVNPKSLGAFRLSRKPNWVKVSSMFMQYMFSGKQVGILFHFCTDAGRRKARIGGHDKTKRERLGWTGLVIPFCCSSARL